ncbi:hypothetical protein CYY_008770 [Polysphondylium violaceum]|uniref:RING-type domain-containing protein n=1 Tax=Polysphondylium violaceum TaxID=133409 RepID=A0A8J4PMH4_9MYCE|nr:hypothetical protein CYY_008770 [Polysphondylium violaceum]
MDGNKSWKSAAGSNNSPVKSQSSSSASSTWKSPTTSPSKNDIDIVSLLSAPPPVTRRVFDPTASDLKKKKETNVNKNSDTVSSNSSAGGGIDASPILKRGGSNKSFTPGNSSTSLGGSGDINFINDPKLSNNSPSSPSSPTTTASTIVSTTTTTTTTGTSFTKKSKLQDNNNDDDDDDEYDQDKLNQIINQDEEEDDDDVIVEVEEVIEDYEITSSEDEEEHQKKRENNTYKSTTSIEEIDPDILKKILNEDVDDEDVFIDESITIDQILLDDQDQQEHQEEEYIIHQILNKTNLIQQAEENEQRLLGKEAPLPMLWKYKNSRKSYNGVVVEPQSYTKITEQLSSADIRRVVGYPTCFTVAKYICIGTTHGYLMIFNFNQELLSIIGGSICADCGPVTATDMPSCRVNEDWLISGHQSGHILLWDISTGKPIKVIEKIHKNPVLHLKFFSDGSRFISSDSSGVTHIVTVTKGFMSIGVDQQLLLNGNLGPVLSIAPLLPGNYPHPTDKSNIVALSTSRKILIISASVEGVYILNNKITKPKSVQSKTNVIPYLSWRRVSYQASLGHTKPLEPILAIGWGTHVQLLQIVTAPNDIKFMNPEFIVVAEYQTDHDICGLEWLDSQTILVMNSKDEMRVLDPFALEEVESINVKSMDIVHHSKFQGVYSFHNSIRTLKSRIYLLGRNGMFTAHILTWLERLSVLIQNDQWFEALCLGLDFYQGKAKATTGLSSNTVDSKVITGEKIVEILTQLCNHIFYTYANQPDMLVGKTLIPKLYLNDMDPMIEQLNIFQQLALISIEFCITIKQTDLLFGEIFNYFVEMGNTGWFLEFLEPYILNDRLSSLNPEVMQYFMSHYQDKDILIRAEQCVLHLDIASIDFHQTVVLCRRHGLYSALIYLYNKGLNDYITPMEDMMEVVITPKTINTCFDDLDKDAKIVAYRMLLYLQYSLSGKAFPTGNIPQSRVDTLKFEIYEYLFLRNIHPEDPTPYPRIYSLLKLDTTELLKILSNGFNDSYFNSNSNNNNNNIDNNGLDINNNDNNNILNVPNLPLNFPINRSNLNTFNMVSVLLLIMIDKSQHPFNLKENSQWPFTLQQQGQLLCILGQCFVDGLFNLDPLLLTRIIGMLSVPTVTTTPLFSAVDRQTTLLNILTSPFYQSNQASNQIDKNKLLLSCEGNDFYKVCQYIYSLQTNFNKMIICQIRDPEWKLNVFDYIRELLNIKGLSEEQINSIKSTSISNLAQLLLIDSSKTAQLIMDCFSSDHEKVLKELSQFPKLQYTYLQGLYNPIISRDTGGGTTTKISLIQSSGLQITNETHELYLRLMCTFSPESVYRYLVSNDKYPLDSCLKICQQFNNFEGSIYLLERTGDVFKALEMFLVILKSKIEDLLKSFKQNFANVKQFKLNAENDQYSQTPQEKELKDHLFNAISLCQRNSQRLQENENETLWFKLFDSIVGFIQKVKLDSDNNSTSAAYSKSISFLTKLVHSILNNMLGYVGIPLILSKIVNEYGTNEFGDFKNIISDMLDTCRFETSILETANDLIQSDMFTATNTYVNRLSRAYVPDISKCRMCYRSLIDISSFSSSLVVFNCNHTFHSECLGKHNACPLCSKDKKLNNNNNSNNKNNSSNTKNQENNNNLLVPDAKTQMDRERDMTLKYLDRLNRYTKQYSKPNNLVNYL